MARIRTVKPEFYAHEELSALSAETHLLAGGLLNYADDDGYFNANPKLIQAAIFPLRELSSTVPVMLTELSVIKYVRLFAGSDGRSYGHICNFKEHQVISHAKESKIKALEASSSVPVMLPEESVLKGKEGKGKEGEGKRNGRPSLETPAGETTKAGTARGLHSTQYAESLLTSFNLAATHSAKVATASVISSVAKNGGMDEADAHDLMKAQAREAEAEGTEIKRFFFEDGNKFTAKAKTVPKQPAWEV